MMGHIYFWHIKALGYCNRQLRPWCKRHGLSWTTLRKEGIDAEELLRIDSSAMAKDVVAFAEKTNWSPVPVGGEDAGKNGGCV